MSKKFAPKRQTGPVTYPAYNANPITLEEEVTAGVIEWYMALGQPVPPEDLEACRGIDAALRAEVDAQMAAPVAVAPPAYGTPEFWKQWWAKKRAKDAAKAASMASAIAPAKEAAAKAAATTSATVSGEAAEGKPLPEKKKLLPK